MVAVASGLPGNIVSTCKGEATGRRRFLPLVTGSPCPRKSRSNKTCGRCGQPKGGRGAVCRACYGLIRKTTLTLTCARCSVAFPKPLYVYEKALRKRAGAVFYYSAACSEADHAVKNARKCRRCSRPMPGEKSHRYCSAECRQAARYEAKGLKEIACPACGALFLPKSARATYCGRVCAGKAHSTRMVGVGNSHFKDGRSYALWFHQMRLPILDRDGFACVACRRGEVFRALRWGPRAIFKSSLAVHHVNEDRTDNRPENLVTLCSTCHAIHHKSHSTPWPWFAEYARRATESTTSRWKDFATSLRARFSSTTA